jgi:MoxR-like ATPase
MLPADITGFYLYSPDGNSRFVPGPIFANIVLADELNRTTPRSQAALLEAMQENQVSIERITHPLPSPFMVIASQLPYGGAGTYPLSEVQIDRFMLRAWSAYPEQEEEKQIIEKIDYIEEASIQPVVTLQEISEVRQLVKEIHISEKVEDYIVTLIEHVRHNPDVLIGPSPRASISLYKGSRVMALLNERDFVIPDDVKKLFLPAIEHRIRIKPEAEMEEVTHRAIVEKALEEVPVPKM